MIHIRPAVAEDVRAIAAIFRACYEGAYSDPHFSDEQMLTKLVYSDDTLVLVAEDGATKDLLGTASVILEAGAMTDLAGEFGRLVVAPEARGRGIGKLLMEERLRQVGARLHIGLVEARVSHPYTVRICQAHGFAAVGFLPLKWSLQQRESLALHVQYFGNALELRRNHPRVIPEAHALAHLALGNCRLPADAIVDEEAPAYAPAGSYSLEDLTAEGYAPLLRIERGRIRRREIFGPLRLHYGFFKIHARRSRYLIAREEGRIAGAIGFMLDPVEKTVRVFELIALHDGAVRFLLGNLERLCREEWDIAYVEVDVSAYAPRMQRTLVELGFLPAAYIPAQVFHEVERLDVVKMVRLLVPPQVDLEVLDPDIRDLAELVLRPFGTRAVLPRLVELMGHLPLCAGLNEEQIHRLAGICSQETFQGGEPIFVQGQVDRRMHVILQGEVEIRLQQGAPPIDVVRTGRVLGEISLLTSAPHSATATACGTVETARFDHEDLEGLLRQRPDIGLQLFRNLAIGLGEKLKERDGNK